MIGVRVTCRYINIGVHMYHSFRIRVWTKFGVRIRVKVS